MNFIIMKSLFNSKLIEYVKNNKKLSVSTHSLLCHYPTIKLSVSTNSLLCHHPTIKHACLLVTPP
jgi:hypothetical protein